MVLMRILLLVLVSMLILILALVLILVLILILILVPVFVFVPILIFMLPEHARSALLKNSKQWGRFAYAEAVRGSKTPPYITAQF